jgi:hypothetical protein
MAVSLDHKGSFQKPKSLYVGLFSRHNSHTTTPGDQVGNINIGTHQQSLQIVDRDRPLTVLELALDKVNAPAQVRELMQLQTQPLPLGAQAMAEGIVLV